MTRRHRKLVPDDGKAARMALLADADLRDLYERLEHDQRIGPTAPGDGDIVLWVSLAISLLLADFHKTDQISPFPRQCAQPPPDSWPSSLGFIGALAWMGEKLFFATYSGAAMVPHEAWTERYLLFEKDLARLWGGRRVRVHKRSKRVDPVLAVKEALRRGVDISDIPKTTGVSRATMYRILKKQE